MDAGREEKARQFVWYFLLRNGWVSKLDPWKERKERKRRCTVEEMEFPIHSDDQPALIKGEKIKTQCPSLSCSL